MQQKVEKLETKLFIRNEKLEIVCTKIAEFFKTTEQLQTVFEKAVEAAHTFRTIRNEI